jgi:5-methylcytosine-specific restriction enzyme subunit McrC
VVTHLKTTTTSMRSLTLTEYTTAEGVELSSSERDVLRGLVGSLTIQPTTGSEGRYDLTPGSTVGVIKLAELQIEFRPRLPIENVLFLVSYALDPRRWTSELTDVAPDDHLLEAIIPSFAHHIRVALRRGLLHGYREVEEVATTIRGRIRFADQLRNRPGIPLPVEITFDEFTDDILENQLLKAAIERLLKLRLRHQESRSTLRALLGHFASVTSRPFHTAPPAPVWTRLNERYRPAVELARLVLSQSGFDLTAGSTTSTGVLLDMAAVFERFVVVALREALGLDTRGFPQGLKGRRVHLDWEQGITLKPDLSWWIRDRCVFVGDCKYKRAKVEGVPNADLYQLLAYLTALDLDEGLLIYAAGEHEGGTHTVRHAGKRLRIVTLDLSGSPADALAEIERLASLVRSQAVRPARAA